MTSQFPVSLSPKVNGPGFRGIFARAFLQLVRFKSSPKPASQRGPIYVKGFLACPYVILVSTDIGVWTLGFPRRESSATEYTLGAERMVLARNAKKVNMLQISSR